MTEATVDRQQAVAELLGAADVLVVTGLGNAANDVAALTDQGDHVFAMDGAMGAAVSVGLGLALAQPTRRVVVVTGDGELLMNLGALATVAVQRPANLAVLCLDNGVYGLTGDQFTHTAHGADLAAMALAAGFPAATTVRDPADLGAARDLLHKDGLAFVRVVVAAGNTRYDALDRNGESIRLRFRRALAGDPRLG
jgi:thiamine pyrophosphate-dependent acetolactate synthase large subunit-like protein